MTPATCPLNSQHYTNAEGMFKNAQKNTSTCDVHGDKHEDSGPPVCCFLGAEELNIPDIPGPQINDSSLMMDLTTSGEGLSHSRKLMSFDDEDIDHRKRRR